MIDDWRNDLLLDTLENIYIYIYMCVCVCFQLTLKDCVNVNYLISIIKNIYIYIHIYIYIFITPVSDRICRIYHISHFPVFMFVLSHSKKVNLTCKLTCLLAFVLLQLLRWHIIQCRELAPTQTMDNYFNKFIGRVRNEYTRYIFDRFKSTSPLSTIHPFVHYWICVDPFSLPYQWWQFDLPLSYETHIKIRFDEPDVMYPNPLTCFSGPFTYVLSLLRTNPSALDAPRNAKGNTNFCWIAQFSTLQLVQICSNISLVAKHTKIYDWHNRCQLFSSYINNEK